LFSMAWNYDGSLLGASSKDKKIRMLDPRQTSSAQTINAFDGAQSSKIFWVPKFNWIGATGFSKTAKRQVKMFDLRKSNDAILSNDIDQAAGVILPHWDNDNGVLYLAAKGEGNINYYELENDEKIMHNLGAYRNPVPQKGGGWLPKRAMDVWKCEVARFLKLTESSVIPISFIVPRKAGGDVFQKDIFPDAYAGVPSLSAQDWLSGQNKDPVLMSMDPKNSKEPTKSMPSQFTKTMTQQEMLSSENERLKNENRELRERVRELEQQLGISNPEPTREESQTEEMPFTEEPQTYDAPPEDQPSEEQPQERTEDSQNENQGNEDDQKD